MNDEAHQGTANGRESSHGVQQYCDFRSANSIRMLILVLVHENITDVY